MAQSLVKVKFNTLSWKNCFFLLKIISIFLNLIKLIIRLFSREDFFFFTILNIFFLKK
jgi:hypothetical protein